MKVKGEMMKKKNYFASFKNLIVEWIDTTT
jgi:hypothetical protein